MKDPQTKILYKKHITKGKLTETRDSTVGTTPVKLRQVRDGRV